MKFDVDGLTIYGHSGGYLGYVSMLMIEPTKNISVSVLINQTEADPQKICTELLKLTYNFVVTAIGHKNDGIPTSFSLKQNYPNPFNPGTIIEFSVPQTSNIKLEVFNTLGQKVSTLVNSKVNAGNHTINYNASELSSGIYIYKILSAHFSDSKKMMLIK